MKAMVCEMCNGRDLIKQDGMYVCQSCGTKYTVEEARKLMIEGTVKIDYSNELSNLYQIARRAKDENNAGNAARYYDMILVKDPINWEAAFYVVYFKAMECKIAEIRSAANSVSNCLNSVLNLIKDHVSDKNEQFKAVSEIVEKCDEISSMLFRGARNHYNETSADIRAKYTQEMLNNCAAARDINYILGDEIDSIFGNQQEYHSITVEAWNLGITQHQMLMKYLVAKGKNKKVIKSYVDKIKKYNSFYKAPKASGCYVATAVYGSYDCPQVWTLRRYRDNTLARTWYGLLFIYVYYAISPTLVKWFGKTGWFQKMWKPKLDKMVERLNQEGVEDTPYNDKQW